MTLLRVSLALLALGSCCAIPALAQDPSPTTVHDVARLLRGPDARHGLSAETSEVESRARHTRWLSLPQADLAGVTSSQTRVTGSRFTEVVEDGAQGRPRRVSRVYSQREVVRNGVASLDPNVGTRFEFRRDGGRAWQLFGGQSQLRFSTRRRRGVPVKVVEYLADASGDPFETPESPADPDEAPQGSDDLEEDEDPHQAPEYAETHEAGEGARKGVVVTEVPARRGGILAELERRLEDLEAGADSLHASLAPAHPVPVGARWTIDPRPLLERFELICATAPRTSEARLVGLSAAGALRVEGEVECVIEGIAGRRWDRPTVARVQVRILATANRRVLKIRVRTGRGRLVVEARADRPEVEIAHVSFEAQVHSETRWSLPEQSSDSVRAGLTQVRGTSR